MASLASQSTESADTEDSSNHDSEVSPATYEPTTNGDYTDVTFFVLIDNVWTKVNGDGTVTYTTAETISGDIAVYPDSVNIRNYRISYNAGTLGNYLQPMGSISVASQVVTQNGSISLGGLKNQSNLTDTYDSTSGDYTVLSPDSDLAQVKYVSSSGKNDPKNRRYQYTFVGWKVKSSGAVLSAGQKLSVGEMATVSEYSGTVELEAMWVGCDATTGRSQSANFYMSTNCEIADNRRQYE